MILDSRNAGEVPARGRARRNSLWIERWAVVTRRSRPVRCARETDAEGDFREESRSPQEIIAPMIRPPLAVALMLVAVAAQPAAQQPAPHAAEHHVFVIKGFRTESGVTLPEARIEYGTYGRLNAARDNVVLLPSHYTANHHGYDWLIGEVAPRENRADYRALDPAKLFLVATELFGNGRSSSPSNTPEPFHGPRFPVTTIRDNVEAVHRLLVEDLKVTHLKAVIGFSMGAQQAFQWAVSYPVFADRFVATSGTAKTYGH